MKLDDPELRARLNSETAKISWKELERHFARGVLIRVAGELDLVEVAYAMARDDKPAVENWLADGHVAPASESEAADWTVRQPTFWAVVTAPWVLVQEIRGEA